MGVTGVLVIAFVLGLDAFSLSVGIGLCGITKRKSYLVSALIACFHVIMPLMGLYLGQAFGDFVGPIADKIGALVLILIGAYYLYENFMADETDCRDFDCSIMSKPWGLFLMAGSVSLDAFVVGFSLGSLGLDLVLTVGVIGCMAGLMTLSGLILGGKINCLWGKKAEFLGGFMLLCLGCYFYFT